MKHWPALRTSIVLSVLFLVVYLGTNRLTALRNDVGVIVFDWERHIPFVPLMIVPYMSIDLFFVIAPFLCAGGDERQVFSKRIVTAILIAGACFLLFPLRFSFERPQADGWLGAVFDSFREMDRPFNQLPSLHIALMAILADVYARNTKGLSRIMLLVWFGLIGVSTLLTYQHHFVDVVGGLFLAAICFHVPCGDGEVVPNRRVGGYYLAGMVPVAVLAWMLKPWGLLLFWPAAGLGIVAYGYFKTGARIYHKKDGRIPLGARVVLAPVLFGQHLSLSHYRRQCRAWDEVTPEILIGRLLTEDEARDAIRKGVTAVLDLTGEFSEVPVFLNITYLNVPVMDLTAPTPGQFRQAVSFIDAQSKTGKVYVHCKIGYSRSAAVVMAWLITSGRASSPEEAAEMIRCVRPSVVIRPEIAPAVSAFVAGK